MLVVFWSKKLKKMNFSDDAMASNSTTKVREVTAFGLVTFLLLAIVVLPIGIVGNILVIIVVRKKKISSHKDELITRKLGGF